MRVNRMLIDVDPTGIYFVWQWKTIKQLYSSKGFMGVYVLKDIVGETLYVGLGGKGEKYTLGKRVEAHIRGWKTSFASSSLGMKRYIYSVEIYEAGNSNVNKHHAALLEPYFKLEYDPVFCKDSPSYSTNRVNNMYRIPKNDYRLWQNWGKEVSPINPQWLNEMHKAKLLP